MDDKLIINADNNTPEVNFDSLSGKLLIKGNCTSENPDFFFSGLYDWLETHLPSFPGDLEFRIQINAYRAQSLLEIARILRLLEKNSMQGKKIRIVWLYNSGDDELMEAGQLVSRMIRNEIAFVES